MNVDIDLTLRAAKAADYEAYIAKLDWRDMVFIKGMLFSPLTNLNHAMRLLNDAGHTLEVGAGVVAVYKFGVGVETRVPVGEGDYWVQMCNAIVTNVAKGFDDEQMV